MPEVPETPRRVTVVVSLTNSAGQSVQQLTGVGADSGQEFDRPVTGIGVVLTNGDVSCRVDLGFDQSGMMTLACGDQQARSVVWTPPVRWFPPHAFTDYGPKDERYTP